MNEGIGERRNSRVSIMMDDNAWRVIEELPHRAPSRAVNMAIREWLGASTRRSAAARMESLRPSATGRLGRPSWMDPRATRPAAIVIVILDVLVLVKSVLARDDEHDGDAAFPLRDRALTGAVELDVPPLWICAAGNTLAKRFCDQAAESLASLVDFGLTEARLAVFVTAAEGCVPRAAKCPALVPAGLVIRCDGAGANNGPCRDHRTACGRGLLIRPSCTTSSSATTPILGTAIPGLSKEIDASASASTPMRT